MNPTGSTIDKSRRSFISAVSAGSAAGLLQMPSHAGTKDDIKAFTLRALPALVHLAPEPHPKTKVWAYDATVPGPLIRVRQGDRLRVTVHNGLDEGTTVHWHGMRVPHAMDGVPDLTQKPIEPGGKFVYEFDAVDAGTFWYHPHVNSSEQVGRGLYGPLIVDEAEPVRVDRELTWVLDDWRLTRSAAIDAGFGNRHDMSHDGRLGNTVTINGTILETVDVRAGERIRLRLINTANARIFGLRFDRHEPIIVALDGQPVTPHAPADGIVVLGPAMRADLVIDMPHKPDQRFTITDRFYQGREYRLVDLAYQREALRKSPPDWPIALPDNPLPEPDIASARRHEVRFTGGMMGGMSGDMRDRMQMMRAGRFWFINGVAAHGHLMEPVMTLARDRSHVISMINDTAWHHPMHLHGHSFRVLSRNQRPTDHRPWQDTVLIAPREQIEIALVADNPGDWMFHCHILEHQQSGMMGVIRVTDQQST